MRCISLLLGAATRVRARPQISLVCCVESRPQHFTVANEDHNCYTFDLRKLDTAMMVHKDHVSAVYVTAPPACVWCRSIAECSALRARFCSMDVSYSPTGREFVSGSYDRTIRIFPVTKGRSREVYHTSRMQRVFTVDYTHDARVRSCFTPQLPSHLELTQVRCVAVCVERQ